MNEYPSTDDVVLDGDPQLNTLRAAMQRYQSGGTDRCYRGVASHAVCAVGAVLAADGVEDQPRMRSTVRLLIEGKLSTAARQAMRALDEVAAELYPDIADPGFYLGPLERLNQSDLRRTWLARKRAVLKVYSEAIARREAELAAESDALHAELAETRELVSV